MTLVIPRSALVLLIGAAGSGKSTFARRLFLQTQVVSSDNCRAIVCDDEADQSATPDAFDLLRTIVRKRLKRRRLTVIDATNVKHYARSRLLPLAFQFNVPVVAIVFDFTPETCCIQNVARTSRTVISEVIQEQLTDLKSALANLHTEGYSRIYIFRTPEEANSVIRLDNSELPS